MAPSNALMSPFFTALEHKAKSAAGGVKRTARPAHGAAHILLNVYRLLVVNNGVFDQAMRTPERMRRICISRSSVRHCSSQGNARRLRLKNTCFSVQRGRQAKRLFGALKEPVCNYMAGGQNTGQPAILVFCELAALRRLRAALSWLFIASRKPVRQRIGVKIAQSVVFPMARIFPEAHFSARPLPALSRDPSGQEPSRPGLTLWRPYRRCNGRQPRKYQQFAGVFNFEQALH